MPGAGLFIPGFSHLEQITGKAMAKCMGAGALANPGSVHGLFCRLLHMCFMHPMQIIRKVKKVIVKSMSSVL